MFKKTITDNSWFIVPFLVFQAVSLYIVPFGNPLVLFQNLNPNHTPFLDGLFKILTNMPEWYGWVLTAILALLLKVRHGIFAIVAMLFSGMMSQIFKHKVFFKEMRPSHYFSPDQLELVEGVELHSHFSFPSGHTTAAFTIMFILCLFLKPKFKPFGALFFIIALLVGYSRLYLNQHFAIDIVAGSALGVISTFLVYLVYQYIFNRLALQWAEKSFLSLFTSLG